MTEQEYRNQIYAKAAKVKTREDFNKILDEVENYKHDYGTIVYGCMAVMKAAFNVLNEGKMGSITGYQASFLGWECVKDFLSIEGPARLLDYSNLLFPQYADKFEKTIPSSTWEWLQKEAIKKLTEASKQVHIEVLNHWKSIAAHKIPFGFRIKE